MDTSTLHSRYFQFLVKVQGFNENGEISIIEPVSPIYVYSRDKLCFHTQSFAESGAYSVGNLFPGDNRLELRIFRDGKIFLNDNIDLALVRKKTVTGIENNNGFPSYTTATDDSIDSDTSNVSAFYYLYYDMNSNINITSETVNTEICHLDIIMEFQRRKQNLSAQEGAASSQQDFENIGYAIQTFDFTPFNSIGVWARKSYKNNVNDVITRGKVRSSGVLGNKKYTRENKKIFMVYVDRDHINASNLINNRFIWNKTVRCFARPDLFAAFLGALREITLTVRSGGFAYPDASSFPSVNHVNGNAVDTNYYIDTGGTIQNDLTFIRAFNKYGRGHFLIGPLKSTLLNQAVSEGIDAVDGKALHNDHLHTERVKIRNR